MPTDVEQTYINDIANNAGINGDAVPSDWQPVTAHDSNAQPGLPCRALRANVAGVIAVYTPKSPAAARLMNFAAGETRYGFFLRVLATGTTATGIEAGT